MEPSVTPAAAPEAPPTTAPEAPVTTTPPVVDSSKPAPDSVVTDVEDQGWDEAAKDYYGNELSVKKGSNKNEPVKPTEDRKTGEKGEKVPGGEEFDAKSGDGNASMAKSEPKTADELARDARAAARQSAEQTKAVITDVRSKMFADVPIELRDSDGDPIHTIEDVMKLINPRTVGEPDNPNGRGFTEDEAAQWLLAAQQQFNQNLAKTEKEIEQVADTNITIKAEADYINSKYGDILRADSALRDRLWAQFERTLVKDEGSGIITKMPVSLEEFYEIALEGRAPAVPATTSPPPTVDPTKAVAEARAVKVAAEKTRQQNRADRSDIYVPPTDLNVVDPEDQEWGEAAKGYYGDRLK